LDANAGILPLLRVFHGFWVIQNLARHLSLC
jgi:hypothetical protein